MWEPAASSGSVASRRARLTFSSTSEFTPLPLLLLRVVPQPSARALSASARDVAEDAVGDSGSPCGWLCCRPLALAAEGEAGVAVAAVAAAAVAAAEAVPGRTTAAGNGRTTSVGAGASDSCLGDAGAHAASGPPRGRRPLTAAAAVAGALSPAAAAAFHALFSAAATEDGGMSALLC